MPRPLDVLCERWWGLPPRVRVLLTCLGAVAIVGVLLADLGRSPHGPPVPVAVATSDLPAGHRLGPGDLADRRWPRDLAPRDGLEVDAEGTLLGPVARGTPVSTGMVGDGGLAALAADGTSVVSLPATLVPGDARGTHLDLVAPDVDGRARVLASAARVLAADEHHVHVEVPTAAAPEVAAAGRGEALVAVLRTP
jgi:Flp pilus assembly protein CpaB